MNPCETCRFALGNECRRRSAQFASHPDYHLIMGWPEHDGKGCGEHEEREDQGEVLEAFKAPVSSMGEDEIGGRGS